MCKTGITIPTLRGCCTDEMDSSTSDVLWHITSVQEMEAISSQLHSSPAALHPSYFHPFSLLPPMTHPRSLYGTLVVSFTLSGLLCSANTLLVFLIPSGTSFTISFLNTSSYVHSETLMFLWVPLLVISSLPTLHTWVICASIY